MTARAREAREVAAVKPSTDDRLDAIEALAVHLNRGAVAVRGPVR